MLTRLRRHRWLWVLSLALLSFKLVAGTICLNDSPVNAHVAPVTQSAAVAAVSDPAAVDGWAGNGDDGTCLLGEAACHCACPETLPVPATVTLDLAPAVSVAVADAPAYAFSPRYGGSPLRPPIA